MGNQKGSKMGNKGFTLIELMITVSIIAILAGIAIPLFNNKIYRGKQVEAKSLLMTIKVEQELFFAENGCYTLLFDVDPPTLPQSKKLAAAGNIYGTAGVFLAGNSAAPCDTAPNMANDFQAQVSGLLKGSTDYWGIADDVPAPVHCDGRGGYTAEQTAACSGRSTTLSEY